MTQLVVQIPALNEAASLAAVMADIPRKIANVDHIHVLVIDDGSSDDTAKVARASGAEVFSFGQRQGLARVFAAGLRLALERGADVIVHTDGDHQYPGRFIPALIAPVLAGTADMVIGARPIARIRNFSPVKKLLQVLGSWVVRKLSGVDVPDAPSGFRAYSREAALRLTIISRFTYTLETLLQARIKGLKVTSIPIEVNEVTRPSRLFKSIPVYLLRSLSTIIRIQLAYHPIGFSLTLYGLGFLTLAPLAGIFFRLNGVILLGGWTLLCAVLAYCCNLAAGQRRRHEEALYYQRKQALRAPKKP